jgi:hypothetical protein
VLFAAWRGRHPSALADRAAEVGVPLALGRRGPFMLITFGDTSFRAG